MPYPLLVAIRTRIVLCMLLLVGAYTLFGVITVQHTARRYAMKTTERVLLDRVGVVEDEIDGALDQLAAATRRAANAEELAPFLRGRRGSVEPAGEALAWIHQHTRATTLMLLDPTGAIQLQTGDTLAASGRLVEHPTVQGALERGLGAWWLVLEGYPYVAAMAPVSDGDERVGLLLAIHPYELDSLEQLERLSGTELVLLSAEGAMVHTLGDLDEAAAADSFARLARHTEGERRPRQVALAGERFMVLEASLGRPGQTDEVGLALALPLETIKAMTQGVRNRFGLVAVGATLLALVLGATLGRTFSRPIEDLVAYARRAAEGEAGAASGPTAVPEMAVLADAMTDLVRQQARRSGRAVAQACRERERELGRHLQAQLEDGDEPAPPGFDTAVGRWRLDRAAGDVVEVLPAADGSLWIALGEVASRGVVAASVAALLRGAVTAAVALQPGDPPSRLLAAVDRAVSEGIRRAGWAPTFAALRLVRLAPDGTLQFAGAQQEMLLLPATGGDVQALAWHGTWLGLGPGGLPDDPDGHAVLSPGDTLVLQTDGLLAGEDGSGRLFGAARVRQLLDQSRGHPARVVRDRLIGAWTQWTATARDDATVVVVRRPAGPGAAPPG